MAEKSKDISLSEIRQEQKTVTLTMLPTRMEIDFERHKIEVYGSRTLLTGKEENYILYDGQELKVAETYNELKQKIK